MLQGASIMDLINASKVILRDLQAKYSDASDQYEKLELECFAVLMMKYLEGILDLETKFRMQTEMATELKNKKGAKPARPTVH